MTRRINIQHRLVYEVYANDKIVHVLRMCLGVLTTAQPTHCAAACRRVAAYPFGRGRRKVVTVAPKSLFSAYNIGIGLQV
jgi:hypothetical protein